MHWQGLNPQSDGCPPEGQLRAFSTGHLRSAALETVGEHLSACPRCEEALARLGDTSDVLVAGLRGCARGRPFEGGPDFERLQAAAREIPAAGWGHPGPAPALGAALPPELLRQYRLLE